MKKIILGLVFVFLFTAFIGHGSSVSAAAKNSSYKGTWNNQTITAGADGFKLSFSSENKGKIKASLGQGKPPFYAAKMDGEMLVKGF